MSRKDYVAIARAVQAAAVTANTLELDALVRELSRVFKADNRAFDATRFARACGASPEADERARRLKVCTTCGENISYGKDCFRCFSLRKGN